MRLNRVHADTYETACRRVIRPAWMKPPPLCVFLMDQRHGGAVGQRVQSRMAGVATVPVADHRAEDIPDETTFVIRDVIAAML